MKILPFYFLILSFLCTHLNSQDDYIDYVDTFIGTGGHGHTFPGATAPFGMVQLSPDTRLTGWDGCSGYHYSDSLIYGFSHTHLSGTGVSDYGDVLLIPFSGKTHFNNGADGEDGYRSAFTKTTEQAQPGYYSVYLEDHKIEVELTVTPRCGFHQYTYADETDKKMILDLQHRDPLLAHNITQIDQFTIQGKRYSKAWAEDQRVHFYIRFDTPIAEIEFNENESMAAISFENNEENRIVSVKVAISAVDVEGARKNLEEEIPNWEFETTKANTQELWNLELSKIHVESSDQDKLVVFYSALYHTMIAPNLYMDVDGRYRGTDHNIHQSEGHTNYTIFSLWDTYRAAHPLYTIIDEQRTNDFINTFLKQYQHGGQLPIWELANNYTGCMIGYHSVPVIADAYIKGIRDFDTELALEAMISSSTANKLGIPEYIETGFIPGEIESESVSKTLEYAYDDWTIATMAEAMDHNETAEKYYKRAQYYKNVFDSETGFMRARLNNRWFSPFYPEEVNHNYTEANSWQYSFYVPQDVTTWMNLLGGERALSQKLDDLFTADSASSGREQADITGLIGQYAHGNEPSHHIAYLYNYVGEAHKTQQLCRQIMDELYSVSPDGYSGNEDCGQMSAWLVLSSLGFYPVTPGSDVYVLGSPWFDKAIIGLANGKEFTIVTDNNNSENQYIQSATLNDEAYTRSFITHQNILDGTTLKFTMGNQPSEFGIAKENRPSSEIETRETVTVPTIMNQNKAFFDETKVFLATVTADAAIYFKINDGPAVMYRQPFNISESCMVHTWATKKGCYDSASASSKFFKMEENREISLGTEYGNHYSAGGNKALIDYIRGGNDYRTGAWQGYEGVNIEAVVDLGKKKKIATLSIGFLQDENSWIFMPSAVTFYASKDGKNYYELGSVSSDINPKDKGTILHDFKLATNRKAKYIKVVAHNIGVCPAYHKGAGGKCWIFADEIMIK